MLKKRTRIFPPALNSFEDEIFLEMISEVIGRKVNNAYFDLNEGELNKLREGMTPDLLLKEKYGITPGILRAFITKKGKSNALVSNPSNKAMIFSLKKLKDVSKFDYQPGNKHNELHQEVLNYLQQVFDSLTALPRKYKNPMECDECGSIFENPYEKRLPNPPIFKSIWSTFHTYTPGRMAFTLDRKDYESVRKAMGNAYLNWICPLCMWREIINFACYKLLGNRDPKKEMILAYSFTGDINDIEDIAAEISYRLKSADTSVGNLDVEEIEDDLEATDFNHILLPHYPIKQKIILFVNGSGLILNYRNKDTRTRVELGKYTHPSLRLRGEAKLLYDALIDIISNWKIGGKELGTIMEISPEERIMRRDELNISVSLFKEILLFMERKVKNIYPSFIDAGKAKPLARWTRIRQLTIHPELFIAKIIRASHSKLYKTTEESDEKKKKKKKSDLNKEFLTFMNEATQIMEKLTKPSIETEFLKEFVNFILSFKISNKTELSKWKIVKNARGEGSYEKPVRDFFHIMNRQQNISQGIDEFVSYLSRRGAELDNALDKIEEFRQYCEEKLPNIDEKKAISISFFNVFRILSELPPEKTEETEEPEETEK